MAPARGYFELELSLTTLETCQRLQAGEVKQLDGRVGKQGTALNKKIKMRMERKLESVSLKLFSNALGPGLSKALNKWVCIVCDKQETNSVKSSKKSKKSKPTKKEDQLPCTETKVIEEGASKTYKLRRKKDQLLRAGLVDVQKDESDNVVANLPSIDGGVKELDNDLVKLETNSQDTVNICNLMSSDIENTVSIIADDLMYNDVDDKNAAHDSEYEDIDLSSKSVPSDEPVEFLSDIKREILQNTVNSKTALRSVQCRFCAKSFCTNPNRPMMALQQHETKFCKRNPWSQTSLEPKPVVSEKYPVSCSYCPKAFRDTVWSKRHEVNCSRNPLYMKKFDMESLMICSICNHMFSNELGLAYHRTKTHGCPSSAKPRKHRKAIPCPCRFCGLMLSSHSTRFFHEHFKCLSNPEMSQGVRCSFCSQMCMEDKLEAHILKHHSEPQHHVCEVCGKVYNGKHKLYQHRMLHKEIQTPSHKCPYCDKVYMLKARLRIHMSKHTSERNVQCATCGKCFKNKHQENKHRILVHENRYRYRCNKCGHGMAKKIYLESHKCGRVRRKQTCKAELQKEDKTGVIQEETLLEKPLVENPLLEKPMLEKHTFPTIVPQEIPAVPEVPGPDRTTGLIGELQQIPVLPAYQFYNQVQEAPQYLVQQMQRYQQQDQIITQQPPISLQYFTS
jgi:KRAB domain-containing zinc finger protein